MRLNWIKIGSLAALAAIGILTTAAIAINFMRSDKVAQGRLELVKRSLPKSSFEFPEAKYRHLAASLFHLPFSPLHLHLPDMKTALIYYGQTGRPDISNDKPKMFFGMQGGKSVISANHHEKIYLHYDRSLTTPSKYIFSENNEPTTIWFSAEPAGQDASIVLEMSELDGILIAKEDPNKYFSLSEKEFIRPSILKWELGGKWRVDGSLLVRQKAKWIGIDRFLANHGGDDFPGYEEKQRIDFSEGDEVYSVFIKKGDFLVWNENRWQEASPPLATHEKPLLVVRKIEDKVMTFDLWDVDGKGKVALTLLKAPESFRHEQIIRDFRFVGARTKTQVVFQVDDERMIVKPNDWLLLTKEGWKKLSTASEIDDYVSRRLIGTLFIFQEVAKKDDKSVLIGSIYNPNRTEAHEIEIAMLPSSLTTPALPSIDQKHHEPHQGATPIAIH